ncbi:serine/threonine-protein phosphatase 6 regulatory subunit 3-like protein [Tanacetum coccineum]
MTATSTAFSKKIIEFISVVITVSSDAAEKQLIRLGALKHSCLESKNTSLIEHILEDCLLVMKIVDAEKNGALLADPKNPTLPAKGRTPPRIGNVRHMTRIANKLIEQGANSSYIESNFQGDSEWVEWQTNVPTKRNTIENVYQWACGWVNNDENDDNETHGIHFYALIGLRHGLMAPPFLQRYHMEFEEDAASVDLDGVLELTGPANARTIWLCAL